MSTLALSPSFSLVYVFEGGRLRLLALSLEGVKEGVCSRFLSRGCAEGCLLSLPLSLSRGYEGGCLLSLSLFSRGCEGE